MLPITKETRFSELPQHLKQKIIGIQKSSLQHYASAEPLKFAKFNYLYSQTQDLQTRNLQKNFNLIVEGAEGLKSICSANKHGIDFRYLHGNLRKALDELKADLILYKKSENNRDFVDELLQTYTMLKNRYEAVTKERRI
jgi:hypothetical protein